MADVFLLALRNRQNAIGDERHPALYDQGGGRPQPSEVAAEDMAVKRMNDRAPAPPGARQVVGERRQSSKGARLRGVCVHDVRLLLIEDANELDGSARVVPAG